MKLRLFAFLLAGIALALGATAIIIQPNYAQNSSFSCDTSKSPPTTIAHTRRGRLEIIRWVSTHLPPNLTREERCEEVSRNDWVYSYKVGTGYIVPLQLILLHSTENRHNSSPAYYWR